MKELLQLYYNYPSYHKEFVKVIFNQEINDNLTGKFNRRSILYFENFIIIPKHSFKDKRAYNFLMECEHSDKGWIINTQENLKIELVKDLTIN